MPGGKGERALSLTIRLDVVGMTKPYDALTRALIEAHPDDWLALFGFDRTLPVRVVDSDLSSITAEADKVLRVDAPEPWLVHVEFQASYEPSLPLRLHRYNALLNYSHRLPVLSIAVLLWSEADGPALHGVLRQQVPEGDCHLEFRYRVVRIWELSVDNLTASLGTLPMAALAVRSADDLEAVVSQVRMTLDRNPPVADEGELWASLFLLIGRRFNRGLAQRLLKGARAMKDSDTYQAILEEGRIEEGRVILLRLGQIRFGEPEATVRKQIEAVDDIERLEQLSERILFVGSWDELLSDPGTRPV